MPFFWENVSMIEKAYLSDKNKEEIKSVTFTEIKKDEKEIILSATLK